MTKTSEVTVLICWTPKVRYHSTPKWLTEVNTRGGDIVTLIHPYPSSQPEWCSDCVFGLNSVKWGWRWSPDWRNNEHSLDRERERESERAPQAALGAHKPPTQNTPWAEAKKWLTDEQTNGQRGREASGIAVTRLWFTTAIYRNKGLAAKSGYEQEHKDSAPKKKIMYKQTEKHNTQNTSTSVNSIRFLKTPETRW